MNDLKSQLIGTWYLKSFDLTVDGKKEVHSDTKGISLFTQDDHYSVCLNQPDTPEKPYNKSLLKNYYSSGKFFVNENSYFEQSVVHAFGPRVGEKREVKTSFENGDLIKEMSFKDSSILRMVWTRKVNI